MTIFFLFMAGILFRADTLPQALMVAHKLIIPATGGDVTTLFLNSTLPVSLSLYLIYLASKYWISQKAKTQKSLNTALAAARNYFETSVGTQIAVYTGMAFVILGFAPMHVSPFIYFQF